MAGASYKGPMMNPPPFVHPHFICRGCNTQLLDCPMLKDAVWEIVSTHWPRGDAKRDLVCLACAEKALGRHIGVADLRNCLGNAFTIEHDKRTMAHVEAMVLEELIRDPRGDMSVLTRLARACHRSASEAQAVDNIRLVLQSILEERT